VIDPEPTPARITLYWSAIWRAAITTVTFAVPLSLLQKWLVESDRVAGDEAVNFLLNLAIMFCGALGGYAAAKLAPTSRLQNGAAAAALGAIVIQVAGAIRHTIIGRDISSPISWIFLALLLSIFGMFGAWVFGKTNGSTT
jgi:hypothetical protein